MLDATALADAVAALQRLWERARVPTEPVPVMDAPEQSYRDWKRDRDRDQRGPETLLAYTLLTHEYADQWRQWRDDRNEERFAERDAEIDALPFADVRARLRCGTAVVQRVRETDLTDQMRLGIHEQLDAFESKTLPDPDSQRRRLKIVERIVAGVRDMRLNDRLIFHLEGPMSAYEKRAGVGPEGLDPAEELVPNAVVPAEIWERRLRDAHRVLHARLEAARTSGGSMPGLVVPPRRRFP